MKLRDFGQTGYAEREREKLLSRSDALSRSDSGQLLRTALAELERVKAWHLHGETQIARLRASLAESREQIAALRRQLETEPVTAGVEVVMPGDTAVNQLLDNIEALEQALAEERRGRFADGRKHAAKVKGLKGTLRAMREYQKLTGQDFDGWQRRGAELATAPERPSKTMPDIHEEQKRYARAELARVVGPASTEMHANLWTNGRSRSKD
jgi:hypothetical protein